MRDLYEAKKEMRQLRAKKGESWELRDKFLKGVMVYPQIECDLLVYHNENRFWKEILRY